MTASARLALAALAAFLGAGCVRNLPGGTPCPSRGGPQWHVYRSRHLDLVTDLDRDTAARHVATLERMRALVLQAWLGRQPELPGRLRVVVPSRRETFWAVAPSNAVGFFHVTQLGSPAIVYTPEALDGGPEIIAHELAHYLSRFVFPRQPAWFAEGLVQFVSTVANTDPRYPSTAGLVPASRARRILQATPVPAGELLGWTGRTDRREADRHHVYAWLLYHWLWNERSAQLTEFQRRLAAAEDPAEAWVSAFPEYDPADPRAMRALDEALRTYRSRGEFTFYKVAAPFDASFTEAWLNSADVHMLLAELDGFAAADIDVSEALREDPNHPVAIVLDAKRRRQAAAPRLRAATDGRPRDWRAWYLLALALEPAGDAPPAAEALAEQEAALRRAIALAPEEPAPHGTLARLLARSDRVAEAGPLAERAAALSPWAPGPLDVLARVRMALGDCRAALELQRRAVALAYDPDGKSPFRERLRTYQGRCGAAAAGSGAP